MLNALALASLDTSFVNFTIKISMRIVIIGLFIILTSNSIAQIQRSRKKVMEVPYKYTKPYDTLNLAPLQGDKTAQPWIVLSDRDSNSTYSTPESGQVFKYASFLEPFYVVEENEQYVHIYKDQNPTKRVSKESIDYGWIKKENLLLWRQALYDQRDILRKVLILNTMDPVKKYKGENKQGSVVFYNDPYLEEENRNEADVFSLYYIFKIFPNISSPSSVLIGRQSYLPNLDVQKGIIGWVDYAKLLPWDFRVVLYPNTTYESQIERENLNIPSRIFCNPTEAVRYINGLEVDNDYIVWDESKVQNMDNDNVFKFPVLEPVRDKKRDSGEIIRVGVIKRIEEELIPIVDPEDARIIEVLDRVSGQRKHLNIIFVIQGSRGMSEYFSRISDALMRFDNYAKDNPEKLKLKTGCLLYRDLASGGKITEVIPLTNNIREISEKITSLPNLHSKGGDVPDAIFFGLQEAVSTFDLPQGQSNVIILIGNTGNHNKDDETRVDIKDIIDQLFYNGYSFFAFQLKHLGTDPYSDFYHQSEEILSSLATYNYDASRFIASKMLLKIPPPGYKIPEKIQENIYFKTKPYSFGGIYALIPGSSMPQNTTSELLSELLIFIYDSINRKMEKLDSIQMILSSANIDSVAGGFVRDFLLPLNLMGSHMAIMQSIEYHNYLTGYVPFTVDSCKYPLWEYQLFYSMDELSELKQVLYQLTSSHRRDNFIAAWTELVKSRKPWLSHSEIQNKTIKELELLLFGFYRDSRFANIKLDEINDQTKLPDTTFSSWLEDIGISSREVDKIFNIIPSYADYSIESNEKRYFWIPLKLFP